MKELRDMGVSISCKKTGKSIDMGYGGFFNLRKKVAELAGGPFAEHYASLNPFGDEEYFEAFDRKTSEILEKKQADIKIVDFCLQSDCDGKIHYGVCKNILKAIGDYDDDIAYGYFGRPDCAMFKDFKEILEDCVKNKCDMLWY